MLSVQFLKSLRAAVHKDVTGLVIILQLALDIDSAAHGLHGNLSPGLLSS